MDEDDSVSASTAADLIVDTLRQILTVLGALLASPAGQTAVSDAAAARSLPALSKALRRVWFDTPMEDKWDSKEEAIWLCHVLAVSEGSREGILSFYGAGIIVCHVFADFARAAVLATSDGQDTEVGNVWLDGLVATENMLRGHHWEQFQQWPADKRCGGGNNALLSAHRLPSTMRRTLDLEGVRLSKAQAAGLGVMMLAPGAMTLAVGGIGATILVKSVRQRMKNGPGQVDPWQRIQSECMQKANQVLRRKTCPVEVVWKPGPHGLPRVRVCLYPINALTEVICVIPAGGYNSDSVACLQANERCSLRPRSDADSFRMRVFKPALIDVALHDGVEVRRGDRVVVAPTPSGEVRCFAEKTGRSESTRPTSSSDSRPSAGGRASDAIDAAEGTEIQPCDVTIESLCV